LVSKSGMGNGGAVCEIIGIRIGKLHAVQRQ
jgi:hypothetical protein